jgi:hypothetical protein
MDNNKPIPMIRIPTRAAVHVVCGLGLAVLGWFIMPTWVGAVIAMLFGMFVAARGVATIVLDRRRRV